MAQPVDFGSPPQGASGYSDNISVSMGEGSLNKRSTRTYKMIDGRW